MSDYIRFVERQVDSCGTQAERFRIGDRHQIRLLHALRAYDVDVWNIAAGGYITTGRGHRTRPLFTEDPAQFDENMFSVAQLYRYGKFTYYNSGDLTGSHWEYNAKPFRRDYETDVADVIGHPVDVIKADHHGQWDQGGMWFPEIFEYGDKLYLYYEGWGRVGDVPNRDEDYFPGRSCEGAAWCYTKDFLKWCGIRK